MDTNIAITNCKLTYQCDKRWEDLQPVEARPSVRYCDSCEHPVFLVFTQNQLDSALSKGKCVCAADSLRRPTDTVGF